MTPWYGKCYKNKKVWSLFRLSIERHLAWPEYNKLHSTPIYSRRVLLYTVVASFCLLVFLKIAKFSQ